MPVLERQIEERRHALDDTVEDLSGVEHRDQGKHIGKRRIPQGHERRALCPAGDQALDAQVEDPLGVDLVVGEGCPEVDRLQRAVARRGPPAAELRLLDFVLDPLVAQQVDVGTQAVGIREVAQPGVQDRHLTVVDGRAGNVAAVVVHGRRNAERPGEDHQEVAAEVTGLSLGRGIMIIEAQVEPIGRLPIEVDTERVVFGLHHVAVPQEVEGTEIAHRVERDGRIDHRAVGVGPAGRIRALEPDAGLTPLDDVFVLRDRVVEGRGEPIVRLKLHHPLHVQAGPKVVALVDHQIPWQPHLAGGIEGPVDGAVVDVVVADAQPAVRGHEVLAAVAL